MRFEEGFVEVEEEEEEVAWVYGGGGSSGSDSRYSCFSLLLALLFSEFWLALLNGW